MEQRVRPFGLRDKLGYALGDCGNSMTLQLMQTYLLVFYTKVLGVPGAIIGTMFMVTKLVDAFTDVGMGRIVDTRTDENGNRFRPWIRRLSIPIVLASCMLYNYFIVEWPLWAKVAYVTIVYLLYGSVCYTGIMIPYGAMANVITDDSTQRTSLSIFRNVGATLASMVIGVVIPLVVFVRAEDGSQLVSAPRFLLLSIVLGILALICYAGCYILCTERIRVANKPAAGTLQGTIKQSFQDLLEVCKNRAVLAVILLNILVFAAMSALQSLLPYVYLDYFGNAKLGSLSNLLMVVAMLLSAPFATMLSKRFGKKEASTVGLGICAIMLFVLFLLKASDPMLFIGFSFMSFLGIGYFSMVCYAMVSDCIEHHYVLTGEHSDGTVYAMVSFVKKLAAAITGSIGAWSLSLMNYDNLATAQTEPVKQAIYNVSVLLPCVFMIVAVVLLVFVYPLDRKTVAENAQKVSKLNQKMRAD